MPYVSQVRTDTASWTFFRQRIVDLFACRGDNAPWRSVAEPTHLRTAMNLTSLPVVSKTSSAGNPQLPHHEGHHARRTYGAATRHQSPPRRPVRPAHLH